MQISELMQELQCILEECGDLEVVEDEYGFPIITVSVINNRAYIQS